MGIQKAGAWRGPKKQKDVALSGTKDGLGLLRYLTDVYGECCEESEKSLYNPGRSAILSWAVLIFGSETLQPGKGMSVSFSQLSSDQLGLSVNSEKEYPN